MTDVFISYVREDRKRVRPLVRHLRNEGLDVWWDENPPGDGKWTPASRRALVEAGAIIVFWSEQSSISSWIVAEATHAHDRKALVPVMLEECKPPAPFNKIISADLVKWKGSTDDEEFEDVIRKTKELVEAKKALESEGPPPAPQPILQRVPQPVPKQAAQGGAAASPSGNTFFSANLGGPRANPGAPQQPATARAPQPAQPQQPQAYRPPQPVQPAAPQSPPPQARAPQPPAPPPPRVVTPISEAPQRAAPQPPRPLTPEPPPRSLTPVDAPPPPRPAPRPMIRPVEDAPAPPARPAPAPRAAEPEPLPRTLRRVEPPPRETVHPVDAEPPRRRGSPAPLILGLAVAAGLGALAYFVGLPMLNRGSEETSVADVAPLPVPGEESGATFPPAEEEIAPVEDDTALPPPAEAIAPPTQLAPPQQQQPQARATPAPAQQQQRPAQQQQAPAQQQQPGGPITLPERSFADPGADAQPGADAAASALGDLERCLGRLVRQCPGMAAGRAGFAQDGALSGAERTLLNQRSLFQWSDVTAANVANCQRHLNAASQSSSYDPLTTACRAFPAQGPQR